MHKKVINSDLSAGRKDLQIFRASKNWIGEILGFIVLISGCAVIAGWILDIEFLKSLRPEWPTMKFTSAVSFALSGLSLYFIARQARGIFKAADLVLPLCSLIVLLVMTSFLISTALGVSTGLENIFIKQERFMDSMEAGKPAVGTMLAFTCFAVTALATLMRFRGLGPLLRMAGLAIASIGLVSTTGFLFDRPFLQWDIEGFSSAIAVHSALLFVLLGAGLYTTGLKPR